MQVVHRASFASGKRCQTVFLPQPELSVLIHFCEKAPRLQLPQSVVSRDLTLVHFLMRSCRGNRAVKTYSQGRQAATVRLTCISATFFKLADIGQFIMSFCVSTEFSFRTMSTNILTCSKFYRTSPDGNVFKTRGILKDKG